MNRKQIKRALGKVTNKRVGDLDMMERECPRGFSRIDVYADTETWYKTYDMRPWEYFGKPGVSCVLAEMTVFPCLISWQYRRRKLNRRRTGTYESGGYVKNTVLIQYLDDFEHFLLDLAMIYNEWRYTPTVYFHNSSYDIPIIEPLLRELDPDIVLYAYVKPTNKGFIRGAFESPKYNVFWEFGDTLQYNRTISINKAGEMMGKPKIKGIPYGLCDARINDGNIEYEDLYTGETRFYPIEKYMEYVERDVDIMRMLNERKYKNMNNVNAIMVEDWEKKQADKFNKYNLTISAHSKRIADVYMDQNGWTSIDKTFRFNLKDYDMANFKDLYQRTVESNCGGYTSYNRKFFRYQCDETQHILYYDRNSMYPTIMTESIPYGDILTEKPDEPHATWYCVEISFLAWNHPMDCLNDEAFGKAKRNGVPFFVLKDYLDFVIANATISYKIWGTYYQRMTKILAPLINKYYDRRKEIKRVMKDLERRGERGTPEYKDLDDKQETLKLLMNALYGKMCEKAHLLGCVFAEGNYHTFENDEEYYPCILSASYITYTARLNLLGKIKAVIESGYDFLYADTDSVIFGCPINADVTPIFGTDSGNLGEWKLEKIYTLFVHNGARKKYALLNERTKEHKLAFSGIPNPIKEQLEDKILSDFKRVERDLKILFNPRENVLIKNCKTIHLLSIVGAQQIMYDTDFQMNSKVGKPTRVMTLGLDDYSMGEWRKL